MIVNIANTVHTIMITMHTTVKNEKNITSTMDNAN